MAPRLGHFGGVARATLVQHGKNGGLCLPGQRSKGPSPGVAVIAGADKLAVVAVYAVVQHVRLSLGDGKTADAVKDFHGVLVLFAQKGRKQADNSSINANFA